MSGESCASSLMRTKNNLTTMASRMPMMPQRIHAGKKDPRMLNEGAREHPLASSVDATAIGTSHLIALRPFRVQQIAGLKCQGSDAGKQVGARAHIRSARRSQCLLC